MSDATFFCLFGCFVSLFRKHENHSLPPSPTAKPGKYRQAGQRNSVTSYWAPKSVRKSCLALLLSVNLKL